MIHLVSKQKLPLVYIFSFKIKGRKEEEGGRKKKTGTKKLIAVMHLGKQHLVSQEGKEVAMYLFTTMVMVVKEDGSAEK